MLEQQGNSVTFYAFYTDDGDGKTGLTVTIDVWEVKKDGTATEIVTAGNATEIGDGLYLYLLAAGSVDEEGEYLAVFKTAGTVDQAHLPAIWAIDRANIENLDQSLSTTESNIRGADSDDLKDISDEVAALNDPAAGAIADAVWDEAKAGHVGAGSFGNEVQAHALSAEIAALNDPTVGAIADQVWDEAGADHVAAGTTGKLLSDAGGGATPATIADAVWDEAKSGHVAAGSFGEEVQAHALSTEVSAPAIADAVWDEAWQDHAEASTFGGLLGLIDDLNDLDATEISAAVWNAQVGTYQQGNSFGEEVQEHATPSEVWDLDMTTHQGIGTGGGLLVRIGAQVWTYGEPRTLSYGITPLATLLADNEVSVYRSATWILGFTIGEIPEGYTNLYFTVKRQKSDTDAQSLLQLSSKSGLLYWDRAAAKDSSLASLTVTDRADGDLDILVDASMTQESPTGQLHYDFKVIDADGYTYPLSAGTFLIEEEVTKAIE